MLKDHFYFRLHPRFKDVVGFEITYEAKRSTNSKDLYEVWFKEPSKKEDKYVLYEEESVKENIDNGTWIIVEEGEN